MLSFEEFKSNLLKKGATSSAVNGKAVRFAYDIFIEEMTDIDTSEYIKAIISKYEKLTAECKEKQSKLNMGLFELQCEKDKFISEIHEFETTKEDILMMETTEGRDAIRKAVFFQDNIDVRNGYDRVAYINGLASVLTNKKVSDVELEKIDEI